MYNPETGVLKICDLGSGRRMGYCDKRASVDKRTSKASDITTNGYVPPECSLRLDEKGEPHASEAFNV